jgi:hypothetical protein
MILLYFDRAGLLDQLLTLPRLGLTSSVRRELRRWEALSEAVEGAIAGGALSLCDLDPSNEEEQTLYFLYRERDGFGDGEATSMAVAYCRGFTFVTHDLVPAAKIKRLGVKVLDWHDLLAELTDSEAITRAEHGKALRQIQGMMRGR